LGTPGLIEAITGGGTNDDVLGGDRGQLIDNAIASGLCYPVLTIA
jgi:hypothetical protein